MYINYQNNYDKLKLFVISHIIINILFSLVYMFLGKNHFNFISNHKDNYITYLYFSITTSVGVGYGDIVPITNIAKILLILKIIIIYSSIIQIYLL